MLLVALIAFTGTGLLIYATSVGPWAGSDSVEYVEAGRNFASGRGLVLIRASGSVVPLMLRPPLYPMVLGLLNSLGVDIINASRWLNITLMAIWVGGLGLLLTRKRGSGWFSITLCAILSIHPVVFEQFAGMMSEPLFFVFGTFGLVANYYSIVRNDARIYFLSILLAGLAMLARYAGFVFVLVGAITQLYRFRDSRARSLLYTAVYLLLGVMPFLIWTVCVRLSGGSPGIYSFEATGLWRQLEPFRLAIVEVLWDWLPIVRGISSFNYREKLFILAIIFGITLVVLPVLIVWNRRRRDQNFQVIQTDFPGISLLGFGLIYLIFIAATYLVVELPKPRLDERILLPGLLALILSSLWFVHRSIFFFAQVRRIQIFTLAFPLLFLNAYLPQTWSYTKDLHAGGWGYSGTGWQQSCLIDEIKKLPDDRVLISDNIEGIMFYTGRPAYRIPDLQTGESRPLEERLGEDRNNQVHELFRNGEALLALFESAKVKFYGTYEEESEMRIRGLTTGLVECISTCDGSVYAYTREYCP